jgi:hypothetical protein
MSEVLGYGEDALTLWALKHHVSDILRQFDDHTQPSDCLFFYRPSFGRHSGGSSAVFGEFDAIVASLRAIYLLESKWDNLAEYKEKELVLRKEQMQRHQIFTWYLTHWSRQYSGKWESFVREQKPNFKFEGKSIPHPDKILAANLEFVLSRLLGHCDVVTEDNIRNVLLFFYQSRTRPSFKVDKTFKPILINYSKAISGNFVPLSP